MNENVKELINTVISNDYCIGCGVCASVAGSPLEMKLDEYGKYRPFIESDQKEELEIDVLTVCPFTNNSKNETEIGGEIFGNSGYSNYDKYIGYYIKNYAGYVKEGEFREKGSSGGMGNWIVTQLLKNNLVDGIIHVKNSDRNEGNNILFEYQISYSHEELSKGAKSKYYPVEMSKVIQFVKENKGRYALIGIPCFIKSIRLLANQDEIIKDRIKFYVGLVCGHLKSDMFAKSIGWQIGIGPDNLKSIDFRKKLEGRLASDYGVEVSGEKDGRSVVLSSPTKELYTTNWGHGLFKYNACEYCDDVLAETADITVGDAWLPEYTKDSMGTNVVVVRNPDIQMLLEENIDSLEIEEISVEKVYQSQEAGFRHRREGLAYRLFLKDQKNEWRPQKRIEASDNLSLKRKRIIEGRTLLSNESFKAFKLAEKENEFHEFVKYMDPILKDYNKIAAPSLVRRALRKMKRVVFQFVDN